LNIGSLSSGDLVRELADPGVWIRTGPFVTHVVSDVPAVTRGLALCYADHPLEEKTRFADFHVAVEKPRNVRRWLHPQVVFRLDNAVPFSPLPVEQAFPLFEWGLNWSITSVCHQYVTIHAAAIERHGCAVILPAPPGSGKSTLCAGLISRGWRLLSDELTLIDPAAFSVVPLARPVGLKNESIAVIRTFSGGAVIGEAVTDTAKGTVAHMKPPCESVGRAGEAAHPRWIVLPRYQADAPASIKSFSKATAFMQLAQQSFNYDLHGESGFKLLARLVDDCDCFEFTYSSLEEACGIFDALSRDA
jgi:HprK-related kinase A